MKDILQTHFEKVYCLNLDTRPDKWELCKQEFKKYGILDLVERFPAVTIHNHRGKLTSQGCTSSHLEIIKKCKRDNISNVLVLEDDIEFLNYGLDFHNKQNKEVPTCCEEILALGLNQLQNIKWDIFYLGYNIKMPEFCKKKILASNIFQSTCQLTTHSIVYNNSVYDTLLNVYENLENKAHLRPSERRIIIDTMLAFYLSHEICSVNIFPMIAGQRTNLMSDITHKVATNKWVRKNVIYNWMEYINK